MADPIEQKQDEGKPEIDPATKERRRYIIIGVVALIVVVSLLFYWRSTYSETTDDAQVDGNLYQVSARVAGQVVNVDVEEEQLVHAGDPIAEVDPKDYQVALEQAEADLANAQAQYQQASVNVPITSTNVRTSLSTTGSDVLAIGQIERFTSPQKLVSYFGLNPSVRQSGLAPARHGHITKIGRAQARGMLVEAAWAAAHTPGPLRAFFLRIRARRGMQIAAVAAARKLAIITWHVLTKNEDYDWVRPALTQKKMRALELQSGFTPAPGSNRGRAYEYNLAAVRASECAASEQAERAYERFVGNFRPKGPRPKSMADLRDSA